MTVVVVTERVKMTKAVIFGNLNPKIKRCCILQAFALFLG